MKTIESLSGTVNGSGTFDETQHVSNAVLWEHPDKVDGVPYFILGLFGAAGLKVKHEGTEIALKWTDLFALATANETNLFPQLPAVTAAPASGVHPQTVTLSCKNALGDAIAGVAIHYTTDGSTPTGSSATYSTPLTVASALTLKAIAIKANWRNSAVASFIYT